MDWYLGVPKYCPSLNIKVFVGILTFVFIVRAFIDFGFGVKRRNYFAISAKFLKVVNTILLSRMRF